MSLGANVPHAQGQSRLSPLQRLTLALLITAQNQRLFGRIQVKPDDIPELGFKVRVIGELKGSCPMRLEIVSGPQLLDATLGNAGLPRHASHTPATSVLRWASDFAEHGIEFTG